LANAILDFVQREDVLPGFAMQSGDAIRRCNPAMQSGDAILVLYQAVACHGDAILDFACATPLLGVDIGE
jgi:hypothetical protein